MAICVTSVNDDSAVSGISSLERAVNYEKFLSLPYFLFFFPVFNHTFSYSYVDLTRIEASNTATGDVTN